MIDPILIQSILVEIVELNEQSTAAYRRREEGRSDRYRYRQILQVAVSEKTDFSAVQDSHAWVRFPAA